MGFGSVLGRTLAEARDEAAKVRRLVRDGIDPIEYGTLKKSAWCLMWRVP